MIEAKVVISCPINYRQFPFHSATCKLRITSFNAKNTSMLFHGNHWTPDRILDPSAKIQGYDFTVSYLTGKDKVAPAWNGHEWFSVMGLKIELISRSGKYIFLYFIPTTMFTMTSWVSYLLPSTSYPARTSLLVTVFLCQVGIFTSAIKDTPNHDEGTHFFSKIKMILNILMHV